MSPHTASVQTTVISESPQNGPVKEKKLAQRQPNDTLDGLESGVAEDVVSWYGPKDPEVSARSNQPLRIAD